MFLGVAIGDALGVPVETYDAARIAREFGRITTYVQNPTHKWSSRKPAGMWSDDTQLTLAVAEAIIETGTLDLDALARWHLTMLDEFGDLGLGGSTRDALNRIRAGIPPADSGRTDNPKRGMGNAMPMKIAPVGAFLAADMRLNPVDGRHNTAAWSRMIGAVHALTLMTHRTEVAVASALAHTYAVQHCLLRDGALVPEKFIRLVSGAAANAYVPDDPAGGDLPSRLSALGSTDTSVLTPSQLSAMNGDDAFIVINTLPLAYACFLRHPTSIDALYEAIEVGGDTDTNASIVGGLVGALNGTPVFPTHLVDGLVMRERILDTAERLCERLGIKE
jgi:ADP-ribosylglycohydrolase